MDKFFIIIFCATEQGVFFTEQMQIGVKNQKAQIRAFQTRSALFTVIYWVRNYI